MLTISGTPRWANGGQNPEPHAAEPPRPHGLRARDRSALLGTVQRLPVRALLVGLERAEPPALPGAAVRRRAASVAPANYAKLYAAAYAGLKAGNPTAQVAIGETSARGSDRRCRGSRPTHSPGKFAELVAKANPRLKFDAWTHHPYPFNPNSEPAQVVKWPNVSLTSLPRFQQSLKKWFKRKTTPIWVTEYGHQTRPQDTFGVSYATQAAYIQQSIAIAKRYPFVGMFIWFVYQDDQGQAWESGLYTQGGAPKGSSPSRFSAPARGRSTRETALLLPRGHDDAARQPLHAPLLRRRTRRARDRHDVARLPRQAG